MPDSGILRELVDAAWRQIADNRPPSHAASRVWSLSGGILSCGVCGHSMQTDRRRNRRDATSYYHYYRCSHRRRHGAEACEQGKSFRAQEIEGQVWEAIVELTANPHAMLRRIDHLIERESGKLRSMDREAGAWLRRLEDLDQQRSSLDYSRRWLKREGPLLYTV